VVLTYEDRRGILHWTGNALWLVLGLISCVWFDGLAYWLVGKLLIIAGATELGHDVGHLAFFTIFPVGKSVYYLSLDQYTALRAVCAVVWLPAGISLFVWHCLWAMLLSCTIVLSPLAIEHIKLGFVALTPFSVRQDSGLDVVPQTYLRNIPVYDAILIENCGDDDLPYSLLSESAIASDTRNSIQVEKYT